MCEYEQKMSSWFGCEAVATSSCTSGLTACLLALNLAPSSYVICPSWSFIASAAAIVAAGLQPYFMDVDEKTWALDPDKVREVVRDPDNVAAVMVVMPFGSPLYLPEWHHIGVPLVIDAAAGFDSLDTSLLPAGSCAVVSTHCTKVFGTGEGGLVLANDLELVYEIRGIINFGFNKERDVIFPGINGKMSEYHAAVGLAEYDGWDEKHEAWLEKKKYYFKKLDEFIDENPVMAPEWASHCYPVRLNKAAEPCIEILKDKGIMTRRIWGTGGHNYPAYKDYPRTDMPVTEGLAESVLFLPFSVDITKDEMDVVAQAVLELSS